MLLVSGVLVEQIRDISPEVPPGASAWCLSEGQSWSTVHGSMMLVVKRPEGCFIVSVQ